MMMTSITEYDKAGLLIILFCDLHHISVTVWLFFKLKRKKHLHYSSFYGTIFCARDGISRL